MKASDMNETLVKRNLFNKIRVKLQLIYRVLVYNDFILFGAKHEEVSFMSTMGANATIWHMKKVLDKFNDYKEAEDAVNDTSNIINGIH